MASITTIGFDADDTLWHNECHFRLTEATFVRLLADHADPDHLTGRLIAAERRNLRRYGFGIKGFVLSMIETAVEVTEGRVSGTVIQSILEAGHEMLAHPVELLPHAEAVLTALGQSHRLVLVTKGDLMDQERKLAQSGLAGRFDRIEIVSAKTPQVYARIFGAAAGGAERAAMVGNSVKSDVLPMIAAGGRGVHVPHGEGWILDHAEPPVGDSRFHKIDDLSGLLPLVQQWGHGAPIDL